MAEVLNETYEFIVESAEKAISESSFDGMLIAYSSLILMALLPVYFGAFRALSYVKRQKESAVKLETMSQRGAALLPVVASGTLLGLYILFKVVSKEYIDILVAAYFFGLGVYSLTHIFSPFTEKLIPERYDFKHTLCYFRGIGSQKTVLINLSFGSADIITFFLCSIVGAMYLWNKHWIINNIFGMAFALNGVELLHLNNVFIGSTLLGGLFFYDVFWVFATDVMVTVAKSFEAPIKLVFPQNVLENWLSGNTFAMLGLGDIVIPGIFIAFLLRFDESLKRGQKLYFYSGFIAYFLGLVLTLVIMSYFKHAQPALLYLVPACIGTPITIAIINGDLKALLKYQDDPLEDESPSSSCVSSENTTPEKELL